MNNKIIVNNDYLNDLVYLLNKKIKNLEDIKNEILLPTLKEYGMNIESQNQINSINKIKTKVTEIEKDLKELSNKLEKTVIPGYEETVNSVKKIFNVDFHNEIDEYINIIKK
jgi:hypothetical protein